MHPWPYHAADEIEAASRVLASGKVNYWNGNEGRAFEEEFAAFCQAPYAVAVANGTLALELALLALGIGKGDEVIVTPRTFLASASSIVMRGAIPVFADVDPDSQNITPETVARVIGPRTKAIMTVHLAGWPCDMHGLRALADTHNLKLIEDCAQAHGATINGEPVGSFGDAAGFSFCTDKIMTTGGEGGMLVLQEKDVWHRAWSYKDHGKAWDTVYNTEHQPGFRWLHESFGTNWRLPEVQSAIGRIQLAKLPDWLARRRRNADTLIKALTQLDALRIPTPPPSIEHAYYKFYAFVRPERLAPDWTRDRIVEEIQAQGAPCAQGSCAEIYLEKAFDNTGWRPEQRLPIARELGDTSLMFQVHPTLEDDDMQAMVVAVENVMLQATR